MTSNSEATDGDDMALSRRGFVAANAVGWSSVALAGCSTQSGDGGAETTPADGTNPQEYVVTDDVITGSEYVPEGFDGFASACAPSRTFVPGMEPVFKIGVYDPGSAESLGNDELSSVSVNIDGGPTVDLEWSGDDEEHPADEWSGPWHIPDDAEPGTYSYTVEVTDGDANFTNVGILESEIEVIEYNDPRNYVVTDDLYAGSAGIPEDNPFATSCLPQRQFAPGMMVGFDIGVYEGRTGNPVGPTDFDHEGVVPGIESATLTIEGQDVTKELAWQGGEGEHSEMGEDLYWNAVWHIPEDVETGTTVTYTVEIESETSSTMVGALANEFTIVDA